MENEPELIRQEMEEKRTELTEKLETLEERVLKTASAITETVKHVEEGVEGTAESIKESFQNVKEGIRGAFNFRAHVERHPVGMVCGSVGAGFLVGLLWPGRRRRASFATQADFAPDWGQSAPRYAASPDGRGAPSGAFAGVTGAVRHGLSRLKDTALGYLFNAVSQTVEQAVPSPLGPQLRSIVDEVASHLRGAGASTAEDTGAGYAQGGGYGTEPRESYHEPNGRKPWEATPGMS